MEMNGWIKLHRQIIDWGWYSDPNAKAVFLHLLLTANLEDKEFLGHKIPKGSTVIGLHSLSEKLGLSVRQVRTALDKLERTGEITRKATNKFTVVTIENWSLYQCDTRDTDKQMTNERQTDDKQMTNERQTSDNTLRIKEYKNIEYKNIYGEFKNVKLTDKEFEKLKTKFPLDYQERIETLSAYIASKGKKYKSHYATILNWARRDEDDTQRAKGNPKQVTSTPPGATGNRTDIYDEPEFENFFKKSNS